MFAVLNVLRLEESTRLRQREKMIVERVQYRGNSGPQVLRASLDMLDFLQAEAGDPEPSHPIGTVCLPRPPLDNLTTAGILSRARPLRGQRC